MGSQYLKWVVQNTSIEVHTSKCTKSLNSIVWVQIFQMHEFQVLIKYFFYFEFDTCYSVTWVEL
jgi:hypothetical protein